MRKLASIQRIRELQPIEGADAIERAQVLGWQLVVKKGEFQVGDLCVYCEIDSLMPDRPEFEFLKPRGSRIRTIRLRGQISQGIAFPLDILPEGTPIEEDADMTELLGITKYEPPMPANLSGVAKGMFPSFIPKTDETRVQVLEYLVKHLAGEPFVVTEKLDGSSATYFVRDEEFGVCSRNLELEEAEGNSFWDVAKALHLPQKLRSLKRNIALQGELVGEGIQGNRLRLRGQHIRFFSGFDIDAYRFLSFSELSELLNLLHLESVPVLEEAYVLPDSVDAIVERATVRSVICPEVWAEGIVLRPVREIGLHELPSREGLSHQVSFKAINPEFLLKFGD